MNDSFLNSSNAPYIAELFCKFKENQYSVNKEWVDFFNSLDENEINPDLFSLTSDHILDLSEPIRQCVIIEKPMKLLCDPECSGLCSNCGANLNQATCECSEGIDPRWSELRKFIPQ